MQQKYQAQLSEVNEAIVAGQALPSRSAHDKLVRKDRLVELLRKRNTLRHYLSVCRKRNNQMLAKTMAIEQLEINAMQLQAIKSTAEAFESFSRKTGGMDNIEDAADKLSEHMETLADIDGIIQVSTLFFYFSNMHAHILNIQNTNRLMYTHTTIFRRAICCPWGSTTTTTKPCWPS